MYNVYEEIANREFGLDYNQLGSGEQEWVNDEVDNLRHAQVKADLIRCIYSVIILFSQLKLIEQSQRLTIRPVSKLTLYN